MISPIKRKREIKIRSMVCIVKWILFVFGAGHTPFPGAPIWPSIEYNEWGLKSQWSGKRDILPEAEPKTFRLFERGLSVRAKSCALRIFRRSHPFRRLGRPPAPRLAGAAILQRVCCWPAGRHNLPVRWGRSSAHRCSRVFVARRWYVDSEKHAG